jgi:hypothetical protein
VTFGSGTSGISGVVSLANSLVGSTASNFVGFPGVTALANGNYVVNSPSWDNGAIADAGAVTFGSGSGGISGVVSPANSLVGSTAGDFVGSPGATALANGNYVVSSSQWDNGKAVDAGAVTFSSGASGTSGVVSPANSLVGSTASNFVGSSRVTALANGNYVVRSPGWDNGAIADAGAVTFGSGTGGISGVVSPANSLVGSTAFDNVGREGVTALANGDYVVISASWNRGAAVGAGAVTFGSGTGGISGVVSPANSLVGSTAGDVVGSEGVTALANGSYVVRSPNWDNGAVADAGAVTLGLFNGSVVGAITSAQSVLGAMELRGSSQTFSYDPLRNQLAVGQPASNRVVLHRPGAATAISIVGDTPDPSVVGQPVTFTATVSATPNAPTNGQVTFTASSGESCVDTSPTPITATMAEFSCAIGFTTAGSSTVIAEYTGSIDHAYSGSDPETHTTGAVVFADGFESP